jgi:hypothetical protein
MKMLTGVVIFALFASPSIPYFKYQRVVPVNGSGQRYIVADDTIWNHARADLGDLRLVSNGTEVPYALIIASGLSRQSSREVPVLQQSTVAGKTQFLVDMSGLEDYDHLRLRISTKDFVAHATIEGQDDPHGKNWASLGSGTIYDLSTEKLGNSSLLRVPRSKFAYLRVTIDGPVKPEEVKGAATELGEEQSPAWREVGSAASPVENGKDTLINLNVPSSVPVERIMLDVVPGNKNFRREIEVQDGKGRWLYSGEVSRIHMVRAGQRIDTENHEVRFSSVGNSRIVVVIHNGDDSPLQLQGVHLQQMERRIYFDSPSDAHLTLYYGDEKAAMPIYDYAKLFQQDKNATIAQLEAETTNAAYTGRPDDRPWSERHPEVLWVAIVAAVLVLGGLAVRSLRTAPAT